jgi:alpha-1,2-mannosyltransferase
LNVLETANHEPTETHVQPQLLTVDIDETRLLARTKVLTALLWVGVLVGAAALSHHVYQVVVSHSDPVDLGIYLRAAREVAGGHSPYLVVLPANGYVYTPLLAILLAPISHVALHAAVRAWAVAGLVALAAAAAACTRTAAANLSSWQRPMLFAVYLCSGLLFWPLAIELELGQIDVFVFAAWCVAGAVVQLGGRRSGFALAAVAASMKVWPMLAFASALGRVATRRWRTLAISLGVGACSLGLSLPFGGVAGLERAVDHVAGARTQQLISYSVWGIPKIWYSNGGVLPILVSPALRVCTTIVLALFVAWLLWLVLRPHERSPMTVWHTLGCLILLLPVTHAYYAIYFLPLLWHWVARAIRVGTKEPITLVVLGVLVVWWLALLRAWPTDGTATPWTSSLEVSVVFLVNLAACSASIAGTWLLRGKRFNALDPLRTYR